MKLSVIIPALNEEKNIQACIKSVKRLNPLEIIVVDGGSRDNTKEIAQGAGAVVIESQKGRGIQMNTGASFAKGDLLMFLHADSQLLFVPSLRAEQSNLDSELIDGLINKNYIGGFFKLKFNDNSLSTRIVEIFANLRARLFLLPYGDQALCIRRDVFDKLNGFREYPFLEDIDFVIRLKKYGHLKYIPYSAIASARRLKKGYPLSPIIVSLRNAAIALLFMAGISPQRLIKFYR